MDKAIDTTAKALASLSHHVSSGKDQGPSKSFQVLIRMIGEAKTKHEEDRIIRKEGQFLKERIGAADVNSRQMREMLIRLIYCEMLGVECSWGYIHAIKMTQSGSIMDKRIGYLAASLFLHENHELNMLLVNTIQKDLKSSNILLVSTALITICKLIGAEMIPPLLPLVQEKLLHPKELVRKKAVMVMYHFYNLSPTSVSHLDNDFRRVISDSDPGVMEAALILFHDMAADHPHEYKDLTLSFTSILSQVVGRKLSGDFDYHGVPAPWIQIRLLRILAILGADDLKTSEQLYPVIEDILASAECNSNIGQAISYECIRTITTIYPNSSLIEKAAKTIGRFVTATNNNWRYLGINSLASLVQISPKYAADHQLVVIDCLDDPDDTLKRKTLDLLYKMTNPSNVAVITDKLIAYLRTAKDEYIRSDLVAKITQLAERFAPDNVWFIQTMNAVFELGGSLVRKEVAHNLMRLIAEGTDDDETDLELRLDAVHAYLDLIDKPHLPDILVKIICWVVGEYGYLAEEVGMEAILEKVTALLGSRFSEADTYGWVVTAVTKLVSQLGHMPESVQSLVAVHLTSTSTDVQQRCSELVELSQDMSVMQEVLPLDASCEDLEIDSSLSFLDGFVSEALAKGAAAYKPPHQRDAPSPLPIPGSHSTGIKFEPYALPQTAPSPSTYAHSKVDTPPSPRTPSQHQDDYSYTHQQPQAPPDTASKDYSYSPKDESLAVKERRWGKTGYNKVTSPAPTQTKPPTIDYTDSEPVTPEKNTSTAVNPAQASILPPSEDEQKRKHLATQLFGGLSGPSRAPRSRQQRRTPEAHAGRAESHVTGAVRGRSSEGEGVAGSRLGSSTGRKAAAARKTEQPPPAVDLLLDLQDIDFSSSPAPSFSANNPPPAATNSPLATTGLMANMEMRTPPQPAPVMPPIQNNLLDLFDSSANENPAPPPSADPLSSSSSSSLVPQLSLLETTVPAPKGGAPLALTLFETPMSSIRVPQQYSQYPIASDCENKDLCQDANLRISLTKVLKDDELVLVFYLTNQRQETLSGVVLTLTPPTAMKVGVASSTTFNTDLSGFANATHVFPLIPSSPALNMSVRGEATYKDHKTTTRRLFCDISIYISDNIRPLNIKTPEYGKKWGSLSYEKKLKISPSTIKTPAAFMEMVKKLNFHPVEIIGSEGIAAGTFLPSTLCLVHGKVLKAHTEFWVRTPSQLLTEAIAKLAQSLLK